MRNTVRRWILCGVIACLTVSATKAPSQTPARSESESTTPAAILPAPLVVGQPPAYVLPPADRWTTAGLPAPDPLLERPGTPSAGLFFNVEPNVLAVHFRNQLQIDVPVSSTQTDTVHFPGPRLDATVSPRFEAGYRLEDGWGELLLGYRFLSTQGSGPETGDLGPAHSSGRLALNSFDLGYGSQEFSLGSDWEMRWRTGVRASILYYDARLSYDPPASDPGTLLNQREVNYFWGLGPFTGLEVAWKTKVPGLSVFGRFDGALQFGNITQTGVETLAGAPGAGPQEALAKYGYQVTVLALAEEVGLSYTVPGWNHSRFLVGYRYETWWQAGRFNFTSSRGQLDTQGVFLRAEFNF